MGLLYSEYLFSYFFVVEFFISKGVNKIATKLQIIFSKFSLFKKKLVHFLIY